MSLRLVIISDTHGLHEKVGLPDGDVLIHCGDCTNDAGQASLRHFAIWMEKQNFSQKILVAGNHDRAFETWPDLAVKLLKEHAPSVTYLQDSGCEIEGFNFWGSPYQPEFYNWAFNLPRGPALKRHWDMIPKSTDVLITHGPPKGQCDYNPQDKFHCGCEDLLNAVMDIQPKVHAFGHIHSAYGRSGLNGTQFINASLANESYRIVNDPIVVDL